MKKAYHSRAGRAVAERKMERNERTHPTFGSKPSRLVVLCRHRRSSLGLPSA